MTANVRLKTEAAAIITELHRSGITSPALLGQVLRISERYARYILTDLGLHKPRSHMTAQQALESCDADLCRWVVQFRNGKRRSDNGHIAA